MNSKQGLTLTEIMIALVIASIASLAFSSLYLNLFQRTTQLVGNVDATIEQNMAEYIVSRDLENSMPSFLDTIYRDRCGRNFFDQFDDLRFSPISTVPGCGNNQTRRIDLVAYRPSVPRRGTTPAVPAVLAKKLILVRSHPKSPFAKPVAPISEQPAPNNLSAYVNTTNAANPLVFNQANFVRGLKSSSLLEDPFNPNGAADNISRNEFYVLYSANPVLDRATQRLRYLRHFFQVGDLASNNISSMTSATFTYTNPAGAFPSGTFPDDHPLAPPTGPPDPNRTIDSVDKFFRTLPGVGGRGVMVFMRQVQFVEYSLELVNYNGRQTHKLVRSEYTRTCCSGFFTKRSQVVALPVKEVSFLRPDVRSPVIKLVIKGDRL